MGIVGILYGGGELLALVGTDTSPSMRGMQVDRLTDNHHSMLLKHIVNHAARWRDIGTFLGFLQGELDTIQANAISSPNVSTVTVCVSTMLAQWLQWAPGDKRGSPDFATVTGLSEALSAAGFGATAHDLRQIVLY